VSRSAILYDADCGFCRWSLGLFLRWDRRGRLRPVALQDPEADRLLLGMDAETKMASWHLVGPDGAVYSAGRAVEPLFRLLPGGRPFAAAAHAMPGLTDRGYAFVARHRTPLGKLVRRLRLSQGSGDTRP
jgi:predicted DCC family thiol-disulfide oxidoreductase YuxK